MIPFYKYTKLIHYYKNTYQYRTTISFYTCYTNKILNSLSVSDEINLKQVKIKHDGSTEQIREGKVGL
jgi:hypothetical protein